MPSTEISQQVREMLATEYEAAGADHYAANIRTRPTNLNFSEATALRAIQSALSDGYRRGVEEAAAVAKEHKPDRIKRGETLKRFDPEDREIIRAEENGEAVAASVIEAAIRNLSLTTGDDSGG